LALSSSTGTFTGGKFDFTNVEENELSLEGVMCYSTVPASDGYVLIAEGTTVRKSAADDD
jgi:hypothetical protein